MIEVRLTEPELTLGAHAGMMRHLSALRDGRRDNHGCNSYEWGWQNHIDGALGELAVAKFMGWYWNGTIGQIDQDDVGRLQVRTSTKVARRNGAIVPNHKLVIHRTDPNDRWFVSVTGVVPFYWLHGFIRGAEAKRAEWLDDPGGRPPAFFVPLAVLRPIEQLKAELAPRPLVPRTMFTTALLELGVIEEAEDLPPE